MSDSKRGPRRWTFARVVVPATCVTVIILRIVFPQLRFDQVSLWLFVVASTVLLIPDIGGILNRVRRIRRGDMEIEFDGIMSDLNRNTEKVEAQAEESLGSGKVYRGLPPDVSERINRSMVSPRGALITIAVEIENVLKVMVDQYDLPRVGGFFSPRRTVQALVDQEVLEPSVVEVFQDFWAARNLAIHQHQFMVNEDRMYEVVDLGVRILRLLYRVDPSASDSV